MIRLSSCLCALLIAGFTSAAPAASSAPAVSSAPVPATSVVSAASSTPVLSTSAIPSVPVTSTVKGTGTTVGSAIPATQTVPGISLDPNFPLWNETTTEEPEAIRGSLGATVLGPVNDPIDKQNPDFLAPPTTDHGSISNAKWPFSLSHNRLQTGGWARQENIGVMPIATEMASVNMRLEAGAVREMHWHKTAEWAYVLKGTTQVSSVDTDGKNYVANVGPGDLWYFPPGIPHSLQATTSDPDGTEFILVFDNGAFSEDSTFLLTDWLAHVPVEVLAKNFQVDDSVFKTIPDEELYIFPANPPATDKAPSDPQGTVSNPFSFSFSDVPATKLSGGSVKVVDSTTFAISKTIAAAEVTVEPGAMRELHWHPTEDEWSFFLEGNARVTIFAAQSNARTFDYQQGDIGYVPASMGHYVENIGNTTLRFLEIFKTDKFEDVSLNQWLALSPPALVKAHLGFSDDIIAKLTKTKQTVIGPA
ncbi:oxalate decarboxylase [Macrolepiota fuliginosa MF-IS2]|uniref:Oxalate decarboxylase n=1 Tax=Macrolepiota fuliginosa MF-IS2 TaxID=1400762 RepID=A0A9P5XE80_9AGAR|nr:oxalate decarboxylase [Macrolepiota fuliginosa MF-IS2]